MADAKVKINIEGNDNTGSAFSSAGSNMDRFGGVAKKLGGVLAAAFAVDKIVDFGKASIDAFEESEVAMARVDGILNTMGASGKKARDSILGMANAAVKLGFDDEDAAESVTRLFQRTNDLTEAQQINAVAMDLARAKNISLGDATSLMLQVLSGGGARALKEYGISVSDTATPMQVLADLQKKVSGQAQGFAATAAGANEVLKVSYQNLQEQVGELLSQALTPLIKSAGDFLNTLPPLTDMMSNVKLSISDFIDVVDEQTGVVTHLKEAWDQIVDTFNTMLLPSLQKLWEAMGPLKPFFSALGTVIGVVLAGAINVLIDVLSATVQLFIFLLAKATDVSTFFTNVLAKSFQAAVGFISDVIAKVEELIAAFQRLNIVQGAKNMVSSISSKLSFAVGGTVPGPLGSPVLATVHGGEQIVPPFSSAFNGGGGVNVNINGGVFLDEYTATEIGNKILDRLQTEFRF